MHRSISILISALIVILIAGCSAQPKPMVIAEFKGSPVYLRQIIYSPELRAVVENTIRDVKIRMLFEKVMQQDLSDDEIMAALRVELQNAGSSENFYEQLKYNNVDWDSKRRAIEVRLMESKLKMFYMSNMTQEDFEAYYQQNKAEMRSILARSRNLAYDQVDEREVRFQLEVNFRSDLSELEFAAGLAGIKHVNLLEDPAIEIIDDDQPIARLMHEGEASQMRDVLYNQGKEEYYGSTIITSADLYGREDFLGSLSSYFARKGLEGWIKEQTAADPALRLPEENLQTVLRDRVLGNFGDSDDPLADLEKAITDRNLDYSEWKSWAALDARVNWILDRQVHVPDEKIREVFFSNEERFRAVLASRLRISQTRVDINDPQQLAVFKQDYVTGVKLNKLNELKSSFLTGETVQVNVLVPTWEPTHFRAKTEDELAAEMPVHDGGYGEGHGDGHGSAEAGDHGDEALHGAPADNGEVEHAAADKGQAQEHPEEPSQPVETH